jgi:hypothetical protein
MFLTVTHPLRVRIPNREFRLTPGRVIEVELNETQVLRLIAHAKDRVRVLTIGSCVAWDSPLFGRCTGEVTMLPEGQWLAIRGHSVTGEAVLLPLDWIIEILPAEEGDGKAHETNGLNTGMDHERQS